jgi:hypothetical protein
MVQVFHGIIVCAGQLSITLLLSPADPIGIRTFKSLVIHVGGFTTTDLV